MAAGRVTRASLAAGPRQASARSAVLDLPCWTGCSHRSWCIPHLRRLGGSGNGRLRLFHQRAPSSRRAGEQRYTGSGRVQHSPRGGHARSHSLAAATRQPGRAAHRCRGRQPRRSRTRRRAPAGHLGRAGARVRGRRRWARGPRHGRQQPGRDPARQPDRVRDRIPRRPRQRPGRRTPQPARRHRRDRARARGLQPEGGGLRPRHRDPDEGGRRRPGRGAGGRRRGGASPGRRTAGGRRRRADAPGRACLRRPPRLRQVGHATAQGPRDAGGAAVHRRDQRQAARGDASAPGAAGEHRAGRGPCASPARAHRPGPRRTPDVPRLRAQRRARDRCSGRPRAW